MTARETLKAIKKLLRAKSRWTQGRMAATKTGGPCQSGDSTAAMWCLAGAHNRVLSENPEAGSGAWDAIESASYRLYAYSPLYVNDQLGFEAVHAVLAEAIRSTK